MSGANSPLAQAGGEVLLRRKELVLRRWEERVRLQLLVARSQPRSALLDHVPVILDDIAAVLAAGPDELDTVRRSCREHALQRASLDGFSLDDLVREYRLLGSVVLETVSEEIPLSLELTLAVFGVINEGIETAAEEFMRVREQSLVEANRRKTEFLAVLGHELRTPLATALNALYVLDQTAPAQERAARQLAVMRRQLDQIARLTDDILDVSRVSQGRLTLARSRLDLAEVVQQAVESCREFLREAQLELLVEVPEGPVHVDGDAQRLEQVLTNLLSNAGKYTDPGGRVSVSLASDGAAAIVRVSDTGIGLAPETIANLFELFAQDEKAEARSRGGLGIGLALVKRLVEAHGGRVEAHSAGRGRGSTFEVRLPLA